MELLDETGDERAITLRSVARRVGIAAPSVCPHFPDQSAIMLAVVQREFAELERMLLAAVESSGDDPRQRLFEICDAYLAFARSHRSATARCSAASGCQTWATAP